MVIFCAISTSLYSQYSVDFEGAGETKTAYASATVSLSGISWDMTEALIGTEAADFKYGSRSARMRGYSTSVMTMLANKSGGFGTLSFSYWRYGTDGQVTWRVDYSTNDGGSWTQAGSTFTAPANNNEQTFSANINVSGNVRIRIIHHSGGNTSTNRRLNIDNIVLTDYTSAITSQSDGDWHIGSTWVGGSVPGNGDNVVIDHIVYSNSAITRNAGTTTTINASKFLIIGSGTYTNNGTTTINGTFQLDDGGWSTGNNFVYGANGTLNFNTTSQYGVSNDHVYWPTTSGPHNVNVLQGHATDGGVRLNSANRTINGTLNLWSGISLNSSTLTLNGSAQINSGGWFTNTPVYGSASTLVYNSGVSYNVGNEWTGSTTVAGAGVPNNVTINGSTTVNLPAGDRGMAGNLTVSDGTLVLNSTAGNDFYIAGNIDFSASGLLTANSRAIFFTKNGTQTISSVNALTIPYVVYQPDSGSTTIQLLSNLTIDAPGGGNAIAFSSASDIFSINGNSLTIGTPSVANTVLGNGAFSGSTSSNLTLNETVFSSTLIFLSGSQSVNNLTINRSSSQNITLGSALTVANSLTLDGLLTIGNNHLTVASITISPDVDNMIITNGTGELRKTFSSAGSFSFPIGENTDALEYTPATLDFSGGTYSGYVGLRVVDAKHPENEATVDYITRYWVVSSSGISPTTYDFSGTYTTADIDGTESNSISGRWDGTMWTPGNTAGSNICSIDGLNTLPATNHFSAGSPLSLAEINIKQDATTYLHNSTYDFGGVPIGDNLDKVFTIENLGAEDLILDEATVTGASFGLILDYSTSVTGSTTTTFTIRFAPPASGSFTGSISIPHNDNSGAENPYVINFTGEGECIAGTPIFTERVGSVGGTTSIADHETADGFDNDQFTMSGTADIRNTTQSSGYTDASAYANVFFTNTVGRYFLIEDINTSEYTCLMLSLGHYKSTTAGNNELDIDVSSDGLSWSSLSYTRPTGDGTANWILINPTGEISAAENLRIRFTQTSSTHQFRIDDITLSGLCATAIFSFSPNSGPVGTVVTINGESFLEAISVKFGNLEADFTVVDDNTIFATVPPNATTGKVTVTKPFCTGTSSFNFMVTTSNGLCFTDLFISEYVEGDGNEKYIEIYNGTGADVDLSDYRLQLFANGLSGPTANPELSGILSHGSVKVYKNSSASSYTGDAEDNGSVNFNGDDAIAIWKISTSSYVDIFGRIGEDPGTAWTSGSHSTLDKTLVRKSSVIGGINENPESGFPTLESEWDLYHMDDVSHLGSHTYDWTGNTLFITSQPTSVCLHEGEDAIFSIITTDSPDLQWYWLDGGTWTALSGETSSTLTVSDITLAMNGYQYFCLVTDGSCTLRSNTVYISVVPNATLSVDGSSTVCHGETVDLQIGYERQGYKFTISILLDGVEETSFNQTNVPSGNPFTYTTQPLVWEGPANTKERKYSVMVSTTYPDVCESDVEEVTITVKQVATVSLNLTPGCGPDSGEALIGSDINDEQTFQLLSASGNPLVPPRSSTVTSDNHTFTSVASGTYTAMVTYNGCNSNLTSTETLANHSLAGIPTNINNDPICGAGTATLSAELGANSSTLEWSYNQTVISGTDLTFDVSLDNGETITVYVRGNNANGCFSNWVPVDAISTLTVTTPVFGAHPEYLCQPAESQNFSATNDRGEIVYSIEIIVPGGGDAPSINVSSGAVTFPANFYGTIRITATVTGCNITTATHDVEVVKTLTPTITPLP